MKTIRFIAANLLFMSTAVVGRAGTIYIFSGVSNGPFSASQSFTYSSPLIITVDTTVLAASVGLTECLLHCSTIGFFPDRATSVFPDVPHAVNIEVHDPAAAGFGSYFFALGALGVSGTYASFAPVEAGFCGGICGTGTLTVLTPEPATGGAAGAAIGARLLIRRRYSRAGARWRTR